MGAPESPADPGLPSDEAFGLLGNEIRMDILRHLGHADGPVSFSSLRAAVGVDDPGQFNYHLNQLVTHFIRQTEDGYALRRPGRRIIEAVLSGAVTEAPERHRTELGWSCMYCGTSPVEMEYREEQLGVYCTECPGSYGNPESDENALPAERQRLFFMHLPPAGVRGRSPEELFISSVVWSETEITHLSLGICPRCSAPVDRDYEACENHDPGEGICEKCNRRLGILLHYECTNCLFAVQTILGMAFSANLRFFGLHPRSWIQPNRSGEWSCSRNGVHLRGRN